MCTVYLCCVYPQEDPDVIGAGGSCVTWNILTDNPEASFVLVGATVVLNKDTHRLQLLDSKI